ncbi:HET-domain-containing protein [Fusarium austroafricanum]|uniref:HET-domain-containing protein n=1 Tax=Fusarium austroafricanum TaxID=2364996 RepID=A0A8H4NQP5_9HYPO|nr:HET-domain-containing protein [Fusarium austroafricanum]
MEERKHQVQLMGLIYSTAARVLIWLGQAEKGANFTMDCLKSLAAGEPLDAHTLSIVKVYFQALFGRSWSTRVWVVQELAKAQRDPLIGHSTASSILSPDNEQSLGRALPIPASVPENQMQGFDNLNQIREHYIAKGGLPLQHVLYLTMDLKVTDPRDKIYAPDYRKPVQKVYTEAMAALLRRAGSLQPACLFAFSRPDSKQMPSWVPDFSNQKRSSPDNPLAFYDGADNALDQRGSYISMTKDTAPLSTDGLYVDRIDNVVPTGIQDESMKHYDKYNLPLSEIEQVALDKINSVAKAAGLRGLGESEPLADIGRKSHFRCA